MTQPSKRRPTIRRVTNDNRPVPVDASGRIIKWGLIAIVSVVACSAVAGLLFVGAPAILAMLGITYYNVAEGLVPTPAPDATTPSLSSSADWVTITEVSPIDNKVDALIAIEANDDIDWNGLAVRPVLYFSCSQENLEAYVNTHTYIGLDDETQTTRTRFGNDSPLPTNMNISSDGSGLFVHDAVRFINQAINHDTFAIEFYPYQEPAKTAVFDIRGLYEALPPVLDACGVER